MPARPCALVELRVLEGPNLYLDRAAIKLTLDVSGLLRLRPEDAQQLAARLGLGRARPGPPSSGFRQRFAARVVARLLRGLAAEVGVTRLAVRVPGRMNVYSLGAVTVVLDLAHNEAGLEALLEITRGLRGEDGRLLLGLGTAGGRTDEVVRALGELGARGANHVVVVHKQRYLRGRDTGDLDALYALGAHAVGVDSLRSHDSELGGLQALVARAGPGDWSQ